MTNSNFSIRLNSINKQVEEIAQGRVWTGRQAKQIGLVDEVGGMREAINETKKLLNVPLDHPIRLKVPPSFSQLCLILTLKNDYLIIRHSLLRVFWNYCVLRRTAESSPAKQDWPMQ